MDFISPILSALAVIIAAVFAYKGTKDTDSTDKLARAAGLYSNYADKMEQRVTAVEAKNVDLTTGQKEIVSRLEASEKEAERYKIEAQSYRKLIVEVIQWITELLDWEAREFNAPAPKTTLSMILSHLTYFIQSKTAESENEEDADDRV